MRSALFKPVQEDDPSWNLVETAIFSQVVHMASGPVSLRSWKDGDVDFVFLSAHSGRLWRWN
jgi:hypothetical protein